MYTTSLHGIYFMLNNNVFHLSIYYDPTAKFSTVFHLQSKYLSWLCAKQGHCAKFSVQSLTFLNLASTLLTSGLILVDWGRESRLFMTSTAGRRSNKTKNAAQVFIDEPAARLDISVSVSADGRRAIHTYATPTLKRKHTVLPQDLDDPLASWNPTENNRGCDEPVPLIHDMDGPDTDNIDGAPFADPEDAEDAAKRYENSASLFLTCLQCFLFYF